MTSRRRGDDTSVSVRSGPGDPGGSGPTTFVLAVRRLTERHPVPTVFLLAMTLWGVVFARVGSVLALGAESYVRGIPAFPRPRVTGDPLEDYRSWSVLPIAVARAAQVSSVEAFATLQLAILVLGTSFVLSLVARHAPRRAIVATLIVFTTATPAYALHFMGSYDQLLVVLLLAALFVRREWAAVAIGALIGLTHAEVGFVSIGMVVVLALVGVGRQRRLRWLTLLGIVVSRLALQVWFSRSGLHTDRWSFVNEYGVGALAGHLVDVWPVVLWSMFGVGWIIVLRAWKDGDRPLRVVLPGIVGLCIVLSAITLDHSRIAILTMLAPFLVVALHLFDASDPWFVPPRSTTDREPSRLVPAAPVCILTAISLASPLVVAWVGRIYVFGSPFRLGW